MKSKEQNFSAAMLCLLIFIAIAAIGVFFDPNYAHGAPADNQNVTVLLNVSNTEPTVYEVFLDDLIPSPTEKISLTAGEYREVLCNATAYDYNGQDDIHNATADLFASGAGTTFIRPLNNASYYRNNTCLETRNIAGTTTNRTIICRFRMEYFAFNTTWTCNMTVRDFGGSQLSSLKVFLNSTGSDTAEVNQLLAINLTTTTVEYGNLSVTETSSEQNINITNVGNVKTNLTVLGYGGPNKTKDLTNINFTSFTCDLNNITLGQHRFSNVSGVTWPNMINLTYNASFIANVTLQNRTNATNPTVEGALNTTYWRVRVPLGVGGNCNGTIEFAATTAAAS